MLTAFQLCLAYLVREGMCTWMLLFCCHVTSFRGSSFPHTHDDCEWRANVRTLPQRLQAAAREFSRLRGGSSMSSSISVSLGSPTVADITRPQQFVVEVSLLGQELPNLPRDSAAR